MPRRRKIIIPKKRPKYLSLTNDLVFRQCLTSSKDALLLLIKSFLPTVVRILDIVVLDPHNADLPEAFAKVAKRRRQSSDRLHLKDTSILPDKPYGKSVVLDILVKLDSGENVNIEMQSTYEGGFISRMLYYWGLSYGQDIDRGDKYSKLNPTHSLIFTDFTVFKELHGHITELKLRATKKPELDLNIPMKIVVVELNKFKKSYLDLVDMTNRWCYIMKHAHHLTAQQEAYLLQDGDTRMVLEHLEEISKDDQLYYEALRRKKSLVAAQLDRRSALEEGMAQGMQEGMQAGKVERDREIALSMLQKGLEVSLISEVTGLSVAEIKQLNGRTAD